MNVLVAGGAGFIGSHIVGRLLAGGHRVVVVDGLLERTGGSRDNLAHLSAVTLVAEPVESCGALPELVADAELVVDCMGWTRHLLALEDPVYDLRLNVGSHLALIRALKATPGKRVIYLGSRGQIGNAAASPIDDDAPRMPVDVQGVHKTAAESHYRVFANMTGTPTLSLIFGNTFGERMPMTGGDIGLVGGFLREVLADRCVDLYGTGRMREFTYAGDLATTVARLCGLDWEGFQALNIPGTGIALEELLGLMIELAGSGSYRLEDWPAEVRAIDIGGARLCTSKIESWLGPVHATPLHEALRITLRSVKSDES